MKDKILAIIHAKGPVIPKDLTKQLKLDTVFAGAHLSELVANKKLHVSTAKIGGSPVYYLPEDKERLQMLYNYMNDKDKAAFDMLKQHKILRDIEQPPVIRVALRGLKDFSVSLTVNLPSGQETFWKWYLTTKDEAEHLIKTKMNLLPNTQHTPTPQTLQPLQQHQILQQSVAQNPEQNISQHHGQHLQQTTQQTEHHAATKHIEEEKQKLQHEKNKFEQEKQQLQKQREELERNKLEHERIQQQKQKEESETKSLYLTKAINSSIKPISSREPQEPIIEQLVPKKIQGSKLQEQTAKKRGRKPKAITQEKKELKLPQLVIPATKEQPSAKLNPQTQLAQPTQITKSIAQQITELNDNFLNYLKSYFDGKQIKINSFNLNRKNADFDLMVSVPTPVGSIQYFCSAKNKQKCNEGDISAAFVQAQSKKLPLLFLSTGELTKKAALMLDNEFKNQVSYQKLNL